MIILIVRFTEVSSGLQEARVIESLVETEITSKNIVQPSDGTAVMIKGSSDGRFDGRLAWGSPGWEGVSPHFGQLS